MIIHFNTDSSRTFSVLPPLFLPFYNQWGANAYRKYEAFSLNPFELRTSSTSGSPVLLGDNCFFGFMNEIGGSFSYDGYGTLTVSAPAGQTLFCRQSCDPYAAWEDYNELLISLHPNDMPQQDFWGGLEFCTWVDQKNAAAQIGEKDVWKPLTEEYVYKYMKRAITMGLPPGKLTIDDGWDIRYAPDGKLCYGNWDINRDKFPHMEQLVKDMTAEGFFPGLWFAPFTATPNSRLATAHPELLGQPFNGSAEAESSRKLMFLHPDSILEDYYIGIFEKFIGMGFRKFKLDMSYGPKREMKDLLAMMYGIIKRLDPSVEVEAHIPDFFVSRFCDTVRINDVNFDDNNLWRGVTYEHYKVCRFSAAGKILNLDHLGTNTPVPDEKRFFEHVRMLLSLKGGFPCVSLLPDFFGTAAAEQYVSLVNDWVRNH